MSLVLASAGDDVKLWESSDLILSRQLNPHDQNVSMVCWASDNSFLASVSLQAQDVAITNMKTFEVSTVPCGDGCMCVDLNDNSRYLLTGGSDSIISVWDLKSNKVKKKYKGHKGPVTCVRFSAETRFIASGSESGEIILYNVTTGLGYKPLVAPNIQAVKQIQYSHHKKSLLGSVSDDGSVNLWDCNAQRLVHSFSIHRAPATALSFSPINDIFLISVGLDKRIACYDVQSKKIVKVMNADTPLTSIDTLSDGVTVAVGSTRGKIFHYDLRMGSVPVKTVDAHKSSVQSLRFQKEADAGNNSKLASASKQSKHRQLPVSPRSSAINKDMTGAPHPADRRPPATGVGEEVFSPLREGFQSGMEEMESSGAGSFTNMTLNVGNNSTDTAYSGGIFSPLNDNNMGRGSSGLAMSPLALSGYGSSEPTHNGSGHGLLDYNRLNTKSGIPDVRLTHPSVDEAMVNGSPAFGQYSQAHVSTPHNGTFPMSTPTQNSLPPGSLEPPVSAQGASGQKHVAFMPEEPDQYIFPSNDNSGSTESSLSPELKRQKQTNQQQHIGMSASPSFPSMHLDESPGSVSGGGAINNSHRPLNPSTPEGVNAQSDIANNSWDNNNISSTRAGADKRPDVLSQSGKVGGATGVAGGVEGMGGLAQVVREVVREELAAFRKDVRTIVYEEVDDMVYQVHSDITNLLTQMIIQFEIQRTEMVTLIQQYSVNMELVAEIERLQEEVKRLQKHF